jgi:cysteine desulfurase
MTSIYLDNNATTYLDPFVADRMHELAKQGIANPASQHRPGRIALSLLEEAKSVILESLGASLEGSAPFQIVLTSGGTEANNLAIIGRQALHPGLTIVGATDHPSVIEAARQACKPADFKVLPVDHLGICDLNLLEEWLKTARRNGQPVSVVSVMLGNNESGVIQALPEISSICHEYDAPLHSDVVQAVGKVPVDVTRLGLSAATITAHKIHGPLGIGALITSPEFKMAPLLVGGGQQLAMRAGTEPVVPTVGLATALEQILAALKSGYYRTLESLRNEFEQTLIDRCEAVVVAADADRLPHTSSIAFPGIDRQALQMSLDLKGVACSTGSACSSGSGRPSGSLVAMGLPDEIVQASLRFSFSRFSTAEQVSLAAEIITECVHKCRLTL